MSEVKTRNRNILKSSQGYTLKKPLQLELPEPRSELEDKLQKYVLQTFTGKSPILAQFCLQNNSTMNIVKHLLLHTTGSKATLYNYIYNINVFVQWLNVTPDFLIKKCLDADEVSISVEVVKTARMLDSYLAYLRAERKLAPKTAYNMVRYVVYFFKLNRVHLELPCRIRTWSLYQDRSPTQEELQKVLEISTLREKVIICMLATGGFRLGTLLQLRYRHVKSDMEDGVVPIHIHVEGEITKTKYHDYDTFLSFETCNYLEAYLQARRDGSYKEGKKSYPPENITDETPLISFRSRQIPLTPDHVRRVVHGLYLRAGLIGEDVGLLSDSRCKRFIIRPHSTRKFFRSHLAFLGVERDFIEYMMGHKTSSYLDVKAKGIEFLRSIYAKSGLSIKPPTLEDKITALKSIAHSWGLNLNEILSYNAKISITEE